jgi:hypothetical protein
MTPDALEALISTYSAAWSETDPKKRRALLETVWEADGVYTDPQALAPGREALDEVIARFQAGNPGATFTLRGGIDHHHKYVRFYWMLRFTTGQEMPGMDYGEISPDGKLSKIVGFF